LSEKPLLLILDRDGVLNEMVVDPEHGTIDSPLHPSQVRLKKDAVSGLSRLQAGGFQFAIATNQPAAAKGKTSAENLVAVHGQVLQDLAAGGIRIGQSFVCYHRAEENCSCRKPRPGLLLDALASIPGSQASSTWMVGDGITDVKAGMAAGLKTAFIAPKRHDIFQILDEDELSPDLWCRDLNELADHLLERISHER
jgi:histidinol-phosphate phosphatase family protein